MDRANGTRRASSHDPSTFGAPRARSENPQSVEPASPLVQHNFSPIKPSSKDQRRDRPGSISSDTAPKDPSRPIQPVFYDPTKPNPGWRIVETFLGPKRFEMETSLYRYLGVPLFKATLMGTYHAVTGGILHGAGLRKARKLQSWGNYYLMGQSERGMRTYCRATLIPELLHGAFAIHSAIGFYKALYSSESAFFGIACAAAYPVTNAYCVMLQRYNRARVARVLSKASSRG